VSVVCAVCKRSVDVPPSRVSRFRTCSHRCAAFRKAGGPPQRLRTCQQCGLSEMVRASRADRPYCSPACYAASLRLPDGASSFRDPEKKRVKDRRFKVKRELIRRGFDPDPGNLTADEWKAILRAFDGRCAYCGDRPGTLTMDHVVPASKGGRHVASNVVPACRFCNQSKRDRLLEPRFVPADWPEIQRVLAKEGWEAL